MSPAPSTTSAPALSRAASMLGASAVRHDRVAVPPPAPRPPPTGDRAVFVGLVLIVLVGAIKLVLRRRLSRRHLVSLDVVMVSIGFVLLLMMRLPIGRHPGWTGAALFVGLPVVYRLLGYFEEPDPE